jgi:hypothetical protein
MKIMATTAQQSVNYNVVRDMIYRLSEKDRTRLIKEITDLAEKKAVDKGYTYDIVPPELQASINRAMTDYKAGRYTTCKTLKEAQEHLLSL